MIQGELHSPPLAWPEIDMQPWKANSSPSGSKNCSFLRTPVQEDVLLSPLDPHFSIDRLLWIIETSRKHKTFTYALNVHAYFCKNSLEAHSTLQNLMVSMFVEVGSMADAQNVFDQMRSPKDQPWDIIIEGYLAYEQPTCAFDLYHRMRNHSFYPNEYNFVALLKTCTKLNSVNMGMEIHDAISKSGLLKQDAYIGTALVDMYAKCGFLAKSKEVFYTLSSKNVVTWNSLIGACVKHGNGEEALQLFERMEAEGVTPNTVTFLCSLNACASIEALEKGFNIHSDIVRKDLLTSNPFIGNALVDMYAKCGLFSIAQELLFQLLTQDVTSWNALIAGFVKYEHSEEALTCFKLMQLNGVFPDAVTYACGIKACGMSEDVAKGSVLHVEIEARGLLKKSTVVGNALVGMYGKCGRLSKSQEVFDKLPSHDLVSWNSLLGGYTVNESDELALVCFEQMQMEGTPPDLLTYAYIAKACGNMRCLERGQILHANILREGIAENHLLTGNALVSMYANCGELDKALEVFSELPSRDVLSYNAIIGGHLREDSNQEVLMCFKKMEEEGVSPNAVTFAYILRACCGVEDIDLGIKMHAEISRRGLIEKNIVLGSPLVEMYAKFGLLANAQAVFNELTDRDLLLWNSLIAGCTNHGYMEEALYFFQKMGLEGGIPDAVTFTSIVKACGSLNDVNQSLQMHAEIERRGMLYEDLAVGNALIDMYTKCGFLTKAHEVLKGLSLRNVVSWSALIAGYAKYEENEAALSCYKEMQMEKVEPDAITLACILKACGSVVDRCLGQEIHSDLERKGLPAGDSIVRNALVDMYMKCGCLRLANELYGKLHVRDVVLWNALMSGYLNHDLDQAVLDCFNRMLLECVLPDEITYFTSLKACSDVGATRKGKEMHARIVKERNLKEELIVGKALVDMYAKGGLLDQAQEVFNDLPVRNVNSWNVLITGFAQLGLVDNVMNMFESMIEEGSMPDLVTFSSVLNACSHTGLVNEALGYLYTMKLYGLIPTVEHLTCMVDLLGRTGLLESALAVMNELPFHPDLVVSSTVLGACRKEGNLSIGRQVFEDSRTVFDNDASMFICMHNLVAETVM